ncbi:MAG: S1 RNA-binding domain-containing protein [Candidatus Micrarchaeia archaeon]
MPETKYINRPKIGEFVIAQISKVMPFGAYCTLPEYGNMEVFLPIKEVSSGWIKNIHEFIHEGQTVVCSVVFYDNERKTIDVSIKKVPQGKAKEKIRLYNLEKRFTAMVHQLIKASHLEAEQDSINNHIKEEFGTYTNFAENAISQTPEFKASKINKKIKDAFIEQLEKIKKGKRYIVSYIATISTNNTESGVTELRNALAKASKLNVKISYISAPKYHITAEGEDYDQAEGKIKKVESLLKNSIPEGIVEFEKEKLKKEKESIFDT